MNNFAGNSGSLYFDFSDRNHAVESQATVKALSQDSSIALLLALRAFFNL